MASRFEPQFQIVSIFTDFLELMNVNSGLMREKDTLYIKLLCFHSSNIRVFILLTFLI